MPASNDACCVGVVVGRGVVGTCVKVSETVVGTGVGSGVVVRVTGISVGVMIIGPGAFRV